MRKKHSCILISALLVIIGAVCVYILCLTPPNRKTYREYSRPTSKVSEGKNDVQGIILHHTATANGSRSLVVLQLDTTKEVSCHAIIDTDGTRYVLAEPTARTWHAGYSMLNGREKCNDFTIGIEFQGNTLEEPLTEDQINSAIDYILPIMKKYNIPKKNIVTHKQVRAAWMAKHPDLVKEKGVKDKKDITQKEYERFMSALEERIDE